MSLLAPLVVVLAVAGEASTAVRVAESGQGLSVAARRAPLSTVLEEIGRQSRTSVTYEGTAPETPVTCDFVASTPGDAFVRVLEGLGLNYVLYGGTADVPRVLLLLETTTGRTPMAASTLPREAAAEPARTPDDEPDGAPPEDDGVPAGRRRALERMNGRGEGGGPSSSPRPVDGPDRGAPVIGKQPGEGQASRPRRAH
jgi:hypothetical protein